MLGRIKVWLRRGRRPGVAGRSRSRAYNLVVLAVSVTLLNIWIAATLPLWSHQIQRYKEKELIFRGLQYAEAIRIFQARYQRYPNNLKELIEVEPRCIRKLWTNPMREDGRWGLVPVGLQGRQRNPNDPNGGQPNGLPNNGLPNNGLPNGGQPNNGLPGAEGNNPDAGILLSADPNETFEAPSTANVQIRGVFAAESKEGIHRFLGREGVGEWQFTVELVSAIKQGDPANPTLQSPFLAHEIGRPWPAGVVPQIPQPTDQPQQQKPQNPGGGNGDGHLGNAVRLQQQSPGGVQPPQPVNGGGSGN